MELAQSFNTFVRRIGVAFSVLALAGALIFASPASNESRADTIPVPNGDFETLYKPGEAPITAIPNGWVDGVGPDAPAGGGAVYSDTTTGPNVDIPGWLGHPGWPPAEDPSAPPPTMNQQGAIEAGLQDTGSYGLGCNGTNWGHPEGEMVVSAASLASIESGLSYTFSVRMAIRGGNLPSTLVWDLLAEGAPLTFSSSVEPAFTADFQTFSKTYDADSLIPHLGKSLTIRLGVDHPSDFGSQMKFDNVSLTFIPEPSTFLLAALGLLSLAWYGWRRRR